MALVTPDEPAAAGEGATLRDVLRREKLYRRVLGLADALAVVASLLIFALWTGTNLKPAVVGIVLLTVVVAKLQGLYDRDELVIRKSTLAELPRILEVAAVTAVAVDLGRSAVSDGQFHGIMFSVAFCAFTVMSMLLARSVARGVARASAPEERCLILGGAESCATLASRISELGGVSLLGTVPTGEVADSAARMHRVVREHRVHRLVIAPDPSMPEAQTLEMVRHAKATGVRVSIFPSVMAAVGGSVVFDELAGFTLLGVPRFGLSRSSQAVKRCFDFVGAAAITLILAPVLLVMALAIKLDSPGPVFFRQIRVGRAGRRFSIVKFRSMVDGAEALKAELLELNEAGQGMFKIKSDPRVTRVGRFLRKSRLDELPQLFNVLKGEMSLVGPRPLVVEEDERVTGHDRGRLHLTPGMTGPWQVLGSNALGLDQMTKLDVLYIANWSLWEDIRILLQTLGLVLGGRGV